MGNSTNRFKEFNDKKNSEGEQSPPEFKDKMEDGRHIVFLNAYDDKENAFVNREQHVVGQESWDLLLGSGLELFQKGGIIVSPVYDENSQVRLKGFDIDRMTGLLSEQITFVKMRFVKGNITVEIMPVPPKYIGSYIINNCDHSKLKAVHTCLNHPFVERVVADDDKEGHIKFRKYKENVEVNTGYTYRIATEGGIHDCGVYLNPRGCAEIQTYETLEEADKILNDIFRDFPYASASSLSNTIGQLVSGCMRFALGTNMPPIALTTSQTHGSGKTMETDCIHAILYGFTANWSSRIASLDEYRKTLLTHALAGDPMVCFDNLNERLNIEALASVATSRRLSGRILHTMSNITVPNFMQICINGTSLDVSTEIADRTIWKVMVTHEKSMDREFKYKAIIDSQVIPNRPAILSAIFTYIKRWIGRGCNISEKKSRLHRAKVWAAVVGGILEGTCWGPEFLTNTSRQRIEADTSYVRWTHSMRELAQKVGVENGESFTREFGVKDAMNICSFTQMCRVDNCKGDDFMCQHIGGDNMLGEDIGVEKKDDQARSTTLGILFRARSKNGGTPFGEWKIVDGGQRSRRRMFRLAWIGQGEVPDDFLISKRESEFDIDGDDGIPL